MSTEAFPSFRLEPMYPSESRKRWFPENLLRLEVATPLEAVVTVIAVVTNEDGEHVRVPIA